MKTEIKIPSMGESVTEATIGSILKPTGTKVEESEEILELETEKVNQLLYAPISGIITWTIKEGETLPIGATLGSIEEGAKEEKKAPKVEAPKAEPSKPPKDVRVIAAHETRVTPQMVVEELKGKAPSPKEKLPEIQEKKEKENETRRPLSKFRQTIAKRLVNVLRESAMLTTFNEVDMSAIIDLRTKYKESFQKKHGVKLGFMSFFVKAVIEGLKSFPDLNSYIDGGEIVHREYFDVGIAVSTEKGLVVPVLRGCDHLSFGEIEKGIEQFAKKAREGGLTLEDLKGGGFTITNGGVFGSLLSTPILNPPQVGILGMHKIMKRAVVVDDTIVIRPMMYLALSYDHRLIDGKEAVSFLVQIKDVLEDPSRLLFLETEN